MQLELERQPQALVARLVGELDHHSAGDIRAQIDEALMQERYPMVVLELSGLTFMDSSGIGLIMGRYRLARSLGSTLRVRGASPRIETVIRLAGMDNLPLWDDERTEEHNETCQ